MHRLLLLLLLLKSVLLETRGCEFELTEGISLYRPVHYTLRVPPNPPMTCLEACRVYFHVRPRMCESLFYDEEGECRVRYEEQRNPGYRFGSDASVSECTSECAADERCTSAYYEPGKQKCTLYQDDSEHVYVMRTDTGDLYRKVC